MSRVALVAPKGDVGDGMAAFNRAGFVDGEHITLKASLCIATECAMWVRQPSAGRMANGELGLVTSKFGRCGLVNPGAAA